MSPQERGAAWEKQVREDLADLDADADDLTTSMAKYHQHLLARGKHSTDEEERANSDAMNSLRKKLSQRGISINNYGPGALFTYRGKSGLTHDLEGWQSVSGDKVNATAKDEAVEKYNQLVAESEAEDRSSIHPAFKPFKPKHADGTPCNAANPATCPKNPLNIAKKQAAQAQMFKGQTDNQWMRQQYDQGASAESINRWRKGGDIPDPDDVSNVFDRVGEFMMPPKTKAEIAKTPRWERKLYKPDGYLPDSAIIRTATNQPTPKAIQQANKFAPR